MTFDYNPAPKPKFKRGKQKRSKRGEFSKEVRDQIKERFDNTCQECGVQGDNLHIHHVKPKGSGIGRGLFSNGLLLCFACHRKVHDDPERLKYWQDKFTEWHGENYYKDKRDLEEEAKALAAEQERDKRFNNRPGAYGRA